MSERKSEREGDKPSGKPRFFGISDAAEVSRFFRPYRTFRSFDFDVGTAGGFRETRCGSILLAAVGQRLQKPTGCSSLGKENAWRWKLQERNGNEDSSIFNPAPREVLIFFFSCNALPTPLRVFWKYFSRLAETPRWSLIARRGLAEERFTLLRLLPTNDIGFSDRSAVA